MAAIEPFSAVPHAAPRGWSLQRVSFAGAEPARVLEFHPLLNVVVTDPAAVEQAVRSLRTVLDGGDGTHVEFTLRDGTALVLFRPFAARHRLIEVDSGGERPLDDLAALLAGGVDDDPAEWRRDVDVVARLAALDQTTLWALAQRLEQTRSGVGDVYVASAPLDRASHPVDTEPRSRARRMLRRRSVPPVPTPSTGPVAESPDVEESWHELVGPLDLGTAARHRDRVDAAALVPARLGALAAVGPADARRGDPVDAVEIAEAVCTVIPANGDGLGPHIVAVPGSVRPEIASLLLDQLAGLSQLRQVVVVTSDDAVIDWANLECHARRASLLRFDPPARPTVAS